jgi:hypothetical protein
MAKPYRMIEVGLTRWQWLVLKASAKAWRDKDVEAHAAYLLYGQIIQVAQDASAEFEESFPVPCLPLWRFEWKTAFETYLPELKGTGRAKFAFRWHPRSWWR